MALEPCKPWSEKVWKKWWSLFDTSLNLYTPPTKPIKVSHLLHSPITSRRILFGESQTQTLGCWKTSSCRWKIDTAWTSGSLKVTNCGTTWRKKWWSGTAEEMTPMTFNKQEGCWRETWIYFQKNLNKNINHNITNLNHMKKYHPSSWMPNCSPLRYCRSTIMSPWLTHLSKNVQSRNSMPQLLGLGGYLGWVPGWVRAPFEVSPCSTAHHLIVAGRCFQAQVLKKNGMDRKHAALGMWNWTKKWLWIWLDMDLGGIEDIHRWAGKISKSFHVGLHLIWLILIRSSNFSSYTSPHKTRIIHQV